MLSSPALANDERFARPRAAGVLTGEADRIWRCALIALVGCGRLGGQLALAIARTGARLLLIDPDLAETKNLATQVGLVPGKRKADTLAEACHAILPGSARSLPTDVRHVGVGELARAQLIVDASDDPGLKSDLARVSNGTQVPLLRVALDADGRSLGRVRTSHGGAGRACACCGSTMAELGPRQRTPCPDGSVAGPPPTLAGLAISMATTGLALEIAQRLIGGTAAETAWDHEWYLDLEGAALHAFETPRVERCPSAHVVFDPCRLARHAGGTSLGELFALARAELGHDDVRIETYGHRIRPLVTCRACGTRSLQPGTRWSAVPDCPDCGRARERTDEGSLAELDQRLARELGILERPLLDLGLPERGALLVARAPDRPPLRFVLDGDLP